MLSPTGQQYERLAWDLVDGWLLTYCGLRIVHAYKRRLADTDVAAGRREWDGRFLTTVEPGWVLPAPDSFKFCVYGGAIYTQPANIAARKLSPSKSPKAQYFAVLEYTAYDKWYETWTSGSGKERKSLLPRLEERLALLKQRVGAAGRRVTNISDEVAVVGVAGPFPCNGDVERILSNPTEAAKYPLLSAMFQANRFVFFQFSAVVGSPKVVGSGATIAAAGGGGGAVSSSS